VILLLVPRLGITGAAMGIFISSAVQTAPFLVLLAIRIARIPLRRLLIDSLAGPAVSGIAAGVVGLILHSRAVNLWSLTAAVAAMGVVFAAVAIVTGSIRQGDIERVSRLLRIPPGRFPSRRLIARWIRP
jgi:O-antigen/teichoic acid export membrane protein